MAGGRWHGFLTFIQIAHGHTVNGHKKLDVSTTDTTVFCFYDIDGDMLRKGKKKVLGRTPYYVVTKLLDPAFFLFLTAILSGRRNCFFSAPIYFFLSGGCLYFWISYLIYEFLYDVIIS